MAARMLNGGAAECPIAKTTLGQFLFNEAKKYSRNICQIDANLQKSETYASVNRRSVRLALSLRRKGLGPEDVVMICSSNTLDNAIPFIATLYLAAKPICMDPSFSTRTAKYLISVVNPKIIFVEESAVSLIEEVVAEAEVIVLGNSNKYENLAGLVLEDPEEQSFKPTEVDVNETALMLFSSGTSGFPKAICHSHRSFRQAFFNFDFVKTENRTTVPDLDVNFHFSSMYWASGVILLFISFIRGGTRIFSQDIDGDTLMKIIEAYKISFMFISPLHTYKLTNAENPGKYDISSLSTIMTGGTSISLKQYKRLKSLFKNVICVYGMTETLTTTRFNGLEIDKFGIDVFNAPCGTVLPGNLIKIVDPDTEQTLDFKQKGEIRIKSQYAMVGYYKIDSTASFDDDGFIKTGDLGYLDTSECLHVVGRIKEMFKYLYWHIVPSLIETVILEHPAVSEAVVFGIPDGENGEAPAACVILKEGTTIGVEEIQDFVADRVVDRERLRGGVYFVDSLPKTPSTKVIRKEIRARILETLSISSE